MDEAYADDDTKTGHCVEATVLKQRLVTVVKQRLVTVVKQRLVTVVKKRLVTVVRFRLPVSSFRLPASGSGFRFRFRSGSGESPDQNNCLVKHLFKASFIS